MFHALIMAGGSGTRLWPLSRQSRPKQALKLVGERTMFQQAVERLIPDFAAAQISVVTRAEHVALLRSQTPDLPLDKFIVEPEGRGTAPAIGLAAIHLHTKDPLGVMAVLTADHYISKKAEFNRALSAACTLAESGRLVTLGITPSFPSTGFGSIDQGQALEVVDGLPSYKVNKFTEKPDQETAARMITSGQFSWNSGMFIWKVDQILAEFKRQMPDLYAVLMQLEAAIGTAAYDSLLADLWPKVAKQTIDYGIMENAASVAVIPVDIGWTDVGSWGSLFDLLPRDADGNIFVGDVLTLDTKGTLVFGNKRLVAAIGLEDLIIVDTEDALLVCTKEKEQQVKEITEHLKNSKNQILI